MRITPRDAALFFDVDGAALAPVGERMAERPTLILLHGGPGYDHSHFRPGFDRFRDQAQVLYLDHRGQGRSDRSTPDKWTLATWADDVADLVTAFSLTKVNLYGVSYGTRWALEVMRRHPGIVRAAVLDGVYPPQVNGEQNEAEIVRRAFERLYADCAADPVCRERHPKVRATIESAIGDSIDPALSRTASVDEISGIARSTST